MHFAGRVLNTFWIAHQLQVVHSWHRGCLQWNQRDISGSWWFYPHFQTLKVTGICVRDSLHNSSTTNIYIPTMRLKAFSSVDPFVLFIGWRSVGWCLDCVIRMSSSPEMRLGAWEGHISHYELQEKGVTTENQMRYPRIFDCTFVGCSSWMACRNYTSNSWGTKSLGTALRPWPWLFQVFCKYIISCELDS